MPTPASPLLLASPRRFLAAVAVAAVLTPAYARADVYDDGFARSREAEARGDLAAAAAALAPLVAAYPQDYDVALQLGWIELRRGRYAAAETAYREAIARSPVAEEAHRGLVTALDRQGRCAEADAALATATAISRSPDAARTAIVTCAPRVASRVPMAPDAPAPAMPAAPPQKTVVSAAVQAYSFPGHPYKSSAQGVTASVDVPKGGFSIGATGRITHIATPDGGYVSAFGQEEAYLRLGYGTDSAGLSVIGAIVRDGSGTLGTSGHVGAIGRLSGKSDLFLTASASFYPDGTALRVSPEWRLTLAPGWYVTPGVALQRALGETLLSASLSVSTEGRWGSLYVGGKYGDELRPAYLGASVVYDLQEKIRWGAWAGLTVRLSDVVLVRATYAFDRLDGTYSGQSTSSSIHSFGIGPVFEF